MRIVVVAVATALATVVTGCTSPPPAPGSYVLSRTAGGQPLRWFDGLAPFVLVGAEHPGYPHARVVAAFARAAARWNAALDGTGVELTLELDASAPSDAVLDGRNAIVWRLPGYCASVGYTTVLCRSTGSLAATTSHFVDEPGTSDDGAMLESDLELNGFAWTYADDGDPMAMDFEGMLAHELGHVLGLRHNCVFEDEYFPWPDSDGLRVPRCDAVAADAELRQATMFPFQLTGDTSTRTPLEVELEGVAAPYADR